MARCLQRHLPREGASTATLAAATSAVDTPQGRWGAASAHDPDRYCLPDEASRLFLLVKNWKRAWYLPRVGSELNTFVSLLSISSPLLVLVVVRVYTHARARTVPPPLLLSSALQNISSTSEGVIERFAAPTCSWATSMASAAEEKIKKRAVTIYTV